MKSFKTLFIAFCFLAITPVAVHADIFDWIRNAFAPQSSEQTFGATAASWLMTNITDGFISPNKVNGVLQGILVNNATSTITNLVMVNSTSTNATSTNAFSTASLCLSGDLPCRTTWPTGGGGTSAFEVATTTDIAIPQLAYFTQTGGRTTLGGAATGTVSAGTGISLDSSVRSVVGGALAITNSSPLSGLIAAYPFSFSNPTLTWVGLSTTTNSGMAQGNLYVGTGGIFQTAASSSIFGFTPVNPTRNLTIAGTANQITSSAGAQDLSADRTWTLSIPADFRVSSTTLSGATLLTNATTTNLAISNVLTFNGVTASTWAAFCTTITGGAGLCDGVDATGAGGTGLSTTSPIADSNILVYSAAGAGSAYGVATGTVSGTNGITVTAGRSAVGGALAIDCSVASGSVVGCLSSVDWSKFNSATTTFSAGLTYVAGNTTLDTASASVFGGLTSAFFSKFNSATTTFSTGITYSAGAVTCNTASGSVFGCLSSTDWTTFDNKQATLSATWPQILTGATLTFGGLSTTSAAVVGNIPYFSGVNTFANVATGTISATTPLSVTAGRSAIGGAAAFSIADALADGATKGAASFTAADFDATAANISIDYTNGQAASASLKGFLTAAFFSKFNSATTTFTTGLTYTAGAVTVNTSQNIATLSNLTGNGYVKTSGGVGTLSVQAVPIPVADGGTNATAFTTSGNGVYWNGTSILTAPLTSAVTYPYASTTAITVSGTASSTFLNVSSLNAAACDVKSTAGVLSCGIDATGGTDPFTYPAATFATTTAALSLPNSGFVGFMGNVAVDTTNYSLFGNTTLTLLNARSGASIGFRIANANVANFTTTGGFAFGSTYYNLDPGQNKMIVESYLGVGTTTPRWPLQLASSTAPQLTLSDASATAAPWNFRAIGTMLYISTSSPTTFATSTFAALTMNSTGLPSLNIGTTSSLTTATTTIFMQKIQFQGGNSSGVQTCAYINAVNAWVIAAGVCP